MSATSRADGRLVGIDLARLVAVAGMMGAHTLSRDAHSPALVALVDGPPSTLFAVLGGVSIVLANRSRRAIDDRGGALRSTLARGFVVLMLGLLVIPLASAVYVVLVPFGVAIMVAAVLVLLPTWLLGLLAALLAAGSGWLVAFARAQLPGREGEHDAVQLLIDPAAAWSDVLVSGVYPALTWVTYMLLGMLAARALLAGRRARRERGTLGLLALAGALLNAGGLAATELGLRMLDPVTDGDLAAARDTLLENAYGAAAGTEPVWQLLAAPHSGTPADIARTAGIALLAIALLCLLATVLPPAARRAIEPLRAAGGAPLTIYVVHVVLFSLLAGLLSDAAPGVVDGWGGWALQLAVALGIGALLAAGGGRGPLERFIGHFAARAGGLHQAGAEQPVELTGATGLTYEWRVRAPIDEVWRAMTEPELIHAWLPDPLLPMTRSEMEVRTGGRYRHEHLGPVGELVVTGEYLEVEPPRLLVQTLRRDGGDRPPVMSTTMLDERGGVTTVRVREEWQTPALRADALAGLRQVAATRHRFAALVERGIDPGRRA